MSRTVTTQSATGIAQGKFDNVSFNILIEGRGNTGPEAKNQTREAVEALQTALNQLKSQGITFKDNEDRSTLRLSKEHRYDEETGRNIFSGYLACYTLKVVSEDVEKTSEIQDVLTSISGAEVASPQFGQEPTTRRSLQKIALSSAFEVIRERLAEECEVLGLNVNDFEIESYNVNYTQQRPNAYSNANFVAEDAFEAAGGGAPIEIKSGLADVGVTLNVSWRRKHQHQ